MQQQMLDNIETRYTHYICNNNDDVSLTCRDVVHKSQCRDSLDYFGIVLSPCQLGAQSQSRQSEY